MEISQDDEYLVMKSCDEMVNFTTFTKEYISRKRCQDYDDNGHILLSKQKKLIYVLMGEHFFIEDLVTGEQVYEKKLREAANRFRLTSDEKYVIFACKSGILATQVSFFDTPKCLQSKFSI